MPGYYPPDKEVHELRGGPLLPPPDRDDVDQEQHDLEVAAQGALWPRGRWPKYGSQSAKLLGALLNGPVCSQSFYAAHEMTHRMAARAYDLRTKWGWPVQSRKCQTHVHKSHAVEYFLPGRGA